MQSAAGQENHSSLSCMAIPGHPRQRPDCPTERHRLCSSFEIMRQPNPASNDVAAMHATQSSLGPVSNPKTDEDQSIHPPCHVA